MPIIQEVAGDTTSWYVSRVFWQLLIVVLVIFPICMLKTMDKLAPFSGVAIVCILTFTMGIFIRSIWVLSDTSLRGDEDGSTAWDISTLADGTDAPGSTIVW